uniref:Uncharacterized protein n=1 Tax=candidate division CPR3 bacterium TaxID=2268181 RepID=A0A7V3JA65_UNCC3
MKLSDQAIERLAQVVGKPDFFKREGRRVDVMDLVKGKTQLVKRANEGLKKLYEDAELTWLDVVKEYGNVRKDASTSGFAEFMFKVGLDERAKEILSEYFGQVSDDFSEKVVRDIEEVLRSAKVKVGKLSEWREWFKRNYGEDCGVVRMITNLIG